MNRLHDIQDRAWGLWETARPHKTFSGRLRDLDVRDYLPTRQRSWQARTHDHFTADMVKGLIVGVGIGVAVGFLFKDNVKPVYRRAKKGARAVARKAKETLPRVNITRVEETSEAK